MRERIKFCISAVFYYSGMVKLLRWWLRRSDGSLIILYYHRADGGNLRKQWLYLRRHYRLLPLEAALQELSPAGTKRARGQDRRTPLALTFDDGYVDNYEHAFALASELQIPMTIFLIPGYTDCGTAFWWADRLIRLAQVDRVAFAERTYHLGNLQERKELALCINQRLAKTASVGERERVLTAFCELLSVPPKMVPGEAPAPLLSWAHVREMGQSGWVSFGAHTLHHPDLAQLTDPAQVEREVRECRTMLEQELEHPVDIFAYPYGHLGDLGLCAVRQSGYKWAVTVSPGFNTHRSDPHLLHRMSAQADRQVLVVAAEAAGVWMYLSRIKSSGRLFIRSLRRGGVPRPKGWLAN